MDNDTDWVLIALAALLAGGALGAVFFAGLWWTVRRGAISATPARWFVGSLVVRTGVALSGFYLIGAGQPVRIGFCLLGFMLARLVVLQCPFRRPALIPSRLTRPNRASRLKPTEKPTSNEVPSARARLTIR